MGGDEHGDDVSVSARIPTRTIILILGSVLFGGVGVGSFFPPRLETTAIQSCFSDAADAKRIAETAVGIAERSAALSNTLTRVVERNGESIADSGHATILNYDKIEALRVSVIERTTSRYTQEDAEHTEQQQERKHANIQREFDRIEKDLDQLQGWHGKE